MAKVLVTGGTGYIGSHTVVELQKKGYEVVIVDNLSNSNIDVLSGIEKITGIYPIFENIDCIDYVSMDRMFEKHRGIDAIIHFAASKAVGESVEKPLMYYRNNLVSLINLLQLMPVHGVKNFVFSSSCTVYGQADVLPVTEKTPIKPAMSPYGNTKQVSEEIIYDTIHANPSYKGIILRYFNPIGAHPSARIGELPIGTPNNLLPYITQTAIGLRDELKVFGDNYNTPDGSCIRDYINVVDLARAHVVALKRLLNVKNKEQVEVFNIGTGKGLSVFEIIHTFEKVNKVKVPHTVVGRREGDIEQIWADASSANKTLKWKAIESVEDTLKSAWKWEKALKKRRQLKEKEENEASSN
jgi:UDP-glucose 4-epimerase